MPSPAWDADQPAELDGPDWVVTYRKASLMVVVCSALVAGLVLGVAAWSLLGLGWLAGLALLCGLLIVIPLFAAACVQVIHLLSNQQAQGAVRRGSWHRSRR